MRKTIANFFRFEPMRDPIIWLDDGEERINYLTHFPGVVVSFIGLILLTRKAVESGDVYRIVSFPIFGLSVLSQYVASTVYHFVKTDRAKKLLRYYDHVAIYFLCTGTYTPYCLVTLRDGIGWPIFWAIWFFGALGAFFKILKFDGFYTLGLYVFIGMGWASVFAMKYLIESLPSRGVYWLLVGGLFYTIGTVFFVTNSYVPYYHAIWHFYVMLGSWGHFMSVYYYC